MEYNLAHVSGKLVVDEQGFAKLVFTVHEHGEEKREFFIDLVTASSPPSVP